MAIGWHFYYEASKKIESVGTEKPFSAEGYLRGAVGPLAPTFREMIPDADSRDLLEYEKLAAAWDREIGRIGEHFQFDADQKAEAAKMLEESKKTARTWFDERENRRKLDGYFRDVEAAYPAGPPKMLMAHEEELLTKKRKELEATRKELVGTVDGWGDELVAGVMGLATTDQLGVSGEFRPTPGAVDGLNKLVMYGMLACGLCMMLGLLTPLAALGTAGFLAMFYLSVPPWPGLPVPPNAEGNYLYVNKNLIELIACLAIAALPTGRWIGVDALLFGWIGRRWRRSSEETAELPA
jgi:uncharacterized membrane protein YphA (DoxX/SURF4 family)